ncbi:hypothetical protein predicted by Glimmer/Critica [Limosilactobacillus fermentum]|nr:hypothetical protein predicted by Glimmer/Critica [Limosilactobacillus fermentum]
MILVFFKDSIKFTLYGAIHYNHNLIWFNGLILDAL